jgi:excisionase family DNA binding protein
MPTEFDYLTAEQAAERAGVTRRTIRRWTASGRLDAAVRLPGAHLFRPADVDAAMAKAEATA